MCVCSEIIILWKAHCLLFFTPCLGKNFSKDVNYDTEKEKRVRELLHNHNNVNVRFMLCRILRISIWVDIVCITMSASFPKRISIYTQSLNEMLSTYSKEKKKVEIYFISTFARMERTTTSNWKRWQWLLRPLLVYQFSRS